MRELKRHAYSAAAIAKFEAEIARIRACSITELRAEWTAVFNREAPKALTKDLLARMLCFRVQEEAYGGYDRSTLRLLENYVCSQPGDRDRLRRLRPGTELFREYQGARHVVMVLEDGFAWRGKTYGSLTTIAKAITGTKWSGPRFFGLLEKGQGSARSGGSVSLSTTSEVMDQAVPQ